MHLASISVMNHCVIFSLKSHRQREPRANSPGPHRQTRHRFSLVTLVFLMLVCRGCLVAWAIPATGADIGKIPVIYCTDLFHPHDDPDDHFDLAAIYAISELEIKLIVLDQGDKQLVRPGRIPVEQMNWITGRGTPTVSGMGSKLRYPTDPAFEQPREFQRGIEQIITTLRNSPQPVMIATTGSVRDVVAAFNREPELFRAKLGKLLVFIGEASDSGFKEYNVELDPQAYIGLMRSGLPVYWVPCFDGGLWRNRGHASFWQAKHSDLLCDASEPLLKYFSYALEKEKSPPDEFMRRPLSPDRKSRLLAGTRNLWCTAILGTVAGRTVVHDSERRVLSPQKRNQTPSAASSRPLYRFSEVALSITDSAVVELGAASGAKKIMRFEILDKAHYAEAMTAATADLIANLNILLH